MHRYVLFILGPSINRAKFKKEKSQKQENVDLILDGNSDKDVTSVLLKTDPINGLGSLNCGPGLLGGGERSKIVP